MKKIFLSLTTCLFILYLYFAQANALDYKVNFLDNFDYSVAVAATMQNFDTSFQSASQSDYESLCIIGKTNGTFVDLSEYEPEAYF